MLFLQQAVTLPQEAGFRYAVGGGDRLAGAPAEGVIQVIRLKVSLRPGSAGGQQTVLCVIGVVLLIQPAAATGQVSPRRRSA